MTAERHNLYSYIFSHLSDELIDEVKQLVDYEEINAHKDPLEL